MSRGFPVRRSIAVVVAAAALLAACGDDPEEAQPEIEGVVVEDGQSNGHVDNPTYDAAPPSGGDHLPPPLWLNCGVYDEPVPDGSAVHSLEHGAVWLAYDPDLADDDVQALVDLVELEPGRVIVSPYPGVESPVVAVAWERRLEVDDAADPRLAEFVEAFVNGSQAPEPAVSCSGAVGEPIG